jgi:hypothetical protein
LFYVTRSIYGRNAWLLEQSFKSKEYKDWQSDKFFEVMLAGVLADNVIATARSQKIQGLRFIVSNIEREFLREARSSISAARVVGENVSEVQLVMLMEKEKLASQLGSR